MNLSLKEITDAESETALQLVPFRILNLPRSNKHITSLTHHPLCYRGNDLTYGEAEYFALQDYWHHVDRKAKQNYPHSFAPKYCSTGLPVVDHDEMVASVLSKIFKCPLIDVAENTSLSTSALPSDVSEICHPNIAPAIAILVFPERFTIVSPYSEFTVDDMVSLSPAMLANSYSKMMFVVYQLLHGMRHSHSLGLSVGDIKLQDIFIDEKLWVRLQQPKLDALYLEGETDVHSSEDQSRNGVNGQGGNTFDEIVNKYCKFSLATLTQMWVYGQLSNFHYLMMLNYLAGRRIDDPNHHPILPWVMDFSSQNSGYRDLSKSKYRLNKGDQQLDISYKSPDYSLPTDSENPHVPHHISDVLSDITYYVYKARRTPKSVLCTYVRSNWVPHEYPSSIQRLQAWSPEECIPEFFTDPTVFSSIHQDLPDLEIPAWASTPLDFITKHMAALEGPDVSTHLHKWIDIAFGYKLSGLAAVRAKNVCLQLVDEHTQLTNHGVVQLFTQPHPARASPHPAWTPAQLKLCAATTNVLTAAEVPTNTANNQNDKKSKLPPPPSRSSAGNRSGIFLPAGFDPLLMLDKFEALASFLRADAKAKPSELEITSDDEDAVWCSRQSLVSRDLQSLACSLVAMLANQRTRVLGSRASLKERFLLCRQVCRRHMDEIPRPFHEVLRLLFLLDHQNPPEVKADKYGALFRYPAFSDRKLPPPNVDLLLHSQFNIIPFPTYFPELYDLFYKYHIFQVDIEQLSAANIPVKDKEAMLSKLHKDLVLLFAKFLNRVDVSVLCEEGKELLMPYIKQLFSLPGTAIHAVWLLFASVSLLLSTEESKCQLLPLVLDVFQEHITSSKHIKLYHRSFIVQLIVRLGLETFLSSFAKPLIEACAGYKDFPATSATDQHQANEPDVEEDIEPQISDTFLTERGSPQPVRFSLGTVDGDGSSSCTDDHSNEDTDVNQDDNSRYFQQLLLEQDDVENDKRNGTSVLNDSTSPIECGKQQSDSDRMSIGSFDTNEGGENEDVAHIAGSLGRISVHSLTRLIAMHGGRGTEFSGTEERPSPALDEQVDEIATQATEFCSESDESMPDPSNHSINDETQSNTTVIQPRKEDVRMPSKLNKNEYNISDIASETIQWLANRLGPVLTAKYLSRDLLRMLALCYVGEDQLMETSDIDLPTSVTGRAVKGDRNAKHVIDCLAAIAELYGEHVILLQYFRHVKQLVQSAQTRLTNRAETGLVASLSLLNHMLPYLSDSTLMDILQETLLSEILLPVLRVVSSSAFTFPSGSRARRALAYRLIDALSILSMRIGFEMTRVNMTPILHNFFLAFNTVYANNGSPGGGGSKDAAEKTIPKTEETTSGLYALRLDQKTNQYQITPVAPSPAPTQQQRTGTGHRRQSSGGTLHSLGSTGASEELDKPPDAAPKESILQELIEAFTPEMAHTAYILFCRLAGDIHIGQSLANDELIRQLCTVHDQSMNSKEPSVCPENGHGEDSQHPAVQRLDSSEEQKRAFGLNVSMVGNRITLQTDTAATSVSYTSDNHRQSFDISYGALKRSDLESCSERHLRGNWLQYWEHEVGLSDQQDAFTFKQIKLITCAGPESWGHSSSVRALCVLDNENSFMSCSKDKTVKLWSLRNFGDGTGKVGCQGTYRRHRKSVFAVAFIDSLRLAASCDSSVHVWDPFIGMEVHSFDSGTSKVSSTPPVTVMTAMPSPYAHLVTATTDSVIRVLDVRRKLPAQEMRCTTTPAGLIRCVSVSPDGKWLAAGYSTGVVSIVDTRTGLPFASWKAHEGEILQAKMFNAKRLVTSSFDQTMAVWNTEDTKLVNPLRGILEPVHCFNFYQSYVISASTANKIGVHSLLNSKQPSCTVDKLRSDVFRGVLTTMAVLPMNRLLLLGADNGQISLVA